MRVLFCVAPLVALAATAPALRALPDHEAPRNATVDASGARLVQVRGRAGMMRIVGRTGITEVRVRGTARASREEDLDDIKLVAERRGDVVLVEVQIPDRESYGWGDRNRALDLVIDVPAGSAMEVDDSSGDIEIRGVGALDLEDSSGDIDLEDLGGAVRIEDSSGGIRVVGVKGDVSIRDSSGDIDARRITGALTVEEDSSGEITVADVTGTVHVRRDSSGGIEVAGVGGDFLVDRDGSGGIDYRDVKGEVRIPQRRGRHRHDW